MTWYLTGYEGGNSTDFALQDGVDIEKLRDEIASTAPGTFVKVPCRLGDQLKTTFVHFDPSKWGAWMLSETVVDELI